MSEPEISIPFNRPPYTSDEDKFVDRSLKSQKMSGDGEFGLKCQKWFETNLECLKTFLVPSCTAALEMAALLIDIQPGDEVIMPSYTFVSTANAFVSRGAKIVFVDVKPYDLNIDETLIEDAITSKTRAIVPVHYAGAGCDMTEIMRIASKYNLYVIEDAAQAMLSTNGEKYLGTIGHLGAFSFHETKNFTSGGEGGLLLVNDASLAERAEIIREKGTNRSKFFRGMVDKYQWVDVGSSYLMSELQAAYLWGQLQNTNDIINWRKGCWDFYTEALSKIEIEKQNKSKFGTCNAHMFYVKAKNLSERSELLSYLNKRKIGAVFHYIPLHSSTAGKLFSRFEGVDRYTTSESERLIRLPMWYGLREDEQQVVVDAISGFYN